MTAREPSDAEVDAAFNDIVARLTGTGDERGEHWADQHPLFAADPDRSGSAGRPDDDTDPPVLRGEVLDPVAPEPDPHDGHDVPDDDGATSGWRVHIPPDDDELDEMLDWDELPRTPLPPWRPSSVAMAALVLVTAAVVVTVLLIAQVRLPWWAGWGALLGFLTGMGLLFSRLPRERDEDSDDGAVV